MEHNPQLYDKIQQLYEEYWEVKNRLHRDSDFFPIINSLEDILSRNPNNEYALQLKIIIKQSYRNKSREELKALREQLCKINPNNPYAMDSKKQKANLIKFLYKILRIMALVGLMGSVLVIILILFTGY